MAAPPPVLTLTVEKGPRKGEICKSSAGSALRVGRVIKGNHLAVRDKGASQQHLSIEFLPPPAARWVVSDLGSSNGSFLNDAPLVPSVPETLSHGDLIKIGESTVLAVSISSDLDLKPAAVADPGRRRSLRCATETAAVEEDKPPAGTRRGTRKKAAVAAIPEVENEVPDAAVVVIEEEKPRRGGRRKVAAAAPPEPAEEGEKDAPVGKRRGGRGKAAEPSEPEEEAPVPHGGGRKKTTAAADSGKEEDEEQAPVVTQTNSMEAPELEKEKEEPRMITRRGRKKNAPTVAPPPQPLNTRSRRGQGRCTRAASTRNAVLEDEEVEDVEVAEPRHQTENLSTSTAVKDVEEEKGDKVTAGDGEIKVAAKASEEEVPNVRASAQCAASDNVGDGEKSGGEEEDDGNVDLVGGRGEVGDGAKVEQPTRSSLETMTLGEWFCRMEKYLPRMINEAADQMIAELEEKQKRTHEYISTLSKSSNPS